jgi:hypothetical protein
MQAFLDPWIGRGIVLWVATWNEERLPFAHRSSQGLRHCLFSILIHLEFRLLPGAALTLHGKSVRLASCARHLCTYGNAIEKPITKCTDFNNDFEKYSLSQVTMLPAVFVALNLTQAAPSCHTTALLILHHTYSDKQISTIVNKVFPPWTFVVCGFTIADGRRSVEVRYGPQKLNVPQT